VALRLLEGDQRMIDAVQSGELGTVVRNHTPTTPRPAEVPV
jgi:hypothetical protein